MILEWTDIAMRLGAAAGAGLLLGSNRDLQNKPIGARTLGLVGLGTATVAAATIQFPGIAENPDAASRVVQGIVQGLMTGISFIGAGVILRDSCRQSVQGLTTAATVWVTGRARHRLRARGLAHGRDRYGRGADPPGCGGLDRGCVAEAQRLTASNP